MMEFVKNYSLMRGGIVEGYAEWFAKRLRDALAPMQQADLIKLLKQNGFEMTQQRLSHYMQGRNYPDPPVLKELAKAMGVSVDYLLGLTEQSLPAADLDEMLAQAKGEARINRIMKNLPPEQRQQVLSYAEFLLTRHAEQNKDGRDKAPLGESARIAIEARKWLDSIERTKGLETRQEIEKIFRDKNLFIDNAP